MTNCTSVQECPCLQIDDLMPNCHLFKIVNDLCDFLDAPVQQREIVYNRQANSLHLQARTSQFHNSFFPKTITIWNSLPFSVLSSPSIKLVLRQSTQLLYSVLSELVT